MPKKVICTLPNASESINGHAFELTDEGAVSKEILSDKDAAKFASIPGYKVVDVQAGGESAPASKAKKGAKGKAAAKDAEPKAEAAGAGDESGAGESVEGDATEGNATKAEGDAENSGAPVAGA